MWIEIGRVICGTVEGDRGRSGEIENIGNSMNVVYLSMLQ